MSPDKNDRLNELDKAARKLGRAIHVRKEAETRLEGWRNYHTEQVAPGYVGVLAKKVIEARHEEQEALDAFMRLSDA